MQRLWDLNPLVFQCSLPKQGQVSILRVEGWNLQEFGLLVPRPQGLQAVLNMTYPGITRLGHTGSVLNLQVRARHVPQQGRCSGLAFTHSFWATSITLRHD